MATKLKVNYEFVGDSTTPVTRTESIKHGDSMLSSVITSAVTALGTKADKSYVNSQDALKANKSYVDTELAKKANAADVTSGLATKADSSTVSALSSRVGTNETNIATQTARIDEIAALPSGSTSGDAELMDIRVGADSKTYTSAGAAVRAQITDVKSDLNTGLDYENEVIKFTTVYGSVNSSGVITTQIQSSAYKITPKISVNSGDEIIYSGSSNWGNCIYAVYSSDNELIESKKADNSSSMTIIENETAIIPNNASYLVISGHSNYIVPKLSKKISKVKEYALKSAEAFNRKIEIEFQDTEGTISSTGVVSRTEGSSRFTVSENINVTPNSVIYVTGSASFGNMIYAVYDRNDTLICFESGSSGSTARELSEKEITVPYNAKYIVVANDNGKPYGIKYSGFCVETDLESPDETNFVEAYIPNKFSILRGYGINTNGIVYGDGTQSTGLIYQISSNYPVNPGEIYYITACANWSNSFYSVFDASGNVIKHETNPTGTSESTIITNHKVVIPENASYMVIAWKTDKILCGSIKTLERRIKSPYLNKKWVCIGDSYTDNILSSEPPKRYYDYISESTGIEIVMMGVGGTGYAKLADQGQAFYQRIVKAPSDADVYTIFGSGNDLSSGLPLGDISDVDTTTICGCINKTIDNLYSVNPIANVAVITPSPWADADLSDEESNWGKYVSALKQIANIHGIPCLDLYHNSGLRPWNEEARTLTYNENDTVHPNSLGHKILSTKIKSLLDSLLI